MVITIDCIETTNTIMLHSLYLTINNVYLTGSGSNTNAVKRYYLDGVREFLIIELTEDIVAPRQFRLGIIFEGSMADKIVGLYSSSYLKEDKTRK